MLTIFIIVVWMIATLGTLAGAIRLFVGAGNGGMGEGIDYCEPGLCIFLGGVLTLCVAVSVIVWISVIFKVPLC